VTGRGIVGISNAEMSTRSAWRRNEFRKSEHHDIELQTHQKSIINHQKVVSHNASIANPTAKEAKAMVQIEISETKDAELGVTFCVTPAWPDAVAVH
jgi:hypothetical protein